MSDIHQGSGTGIMVAAVVGAAIGAGVALLLAPCSGRETREWLARRTRDIKDKTTSMIGREIDEIVNTPDRPVYTDAVGARMRS